MSKSRLDPEVLDRNLPANVEAEMAVIGSMLQKPDVCDDVVSVVRANDFDDERNSILFGRIIELRNAGKRIDTKLLYESLSKSGQLEKAGGAARIGECHQSVPTAAHAVYYAEIVRDRAVLRDVITVGTEMCRKGYDTQQVGKELLEECEQQIFAISENRSTVESVSELPELLMQAMARIDSRMANKGVSGLSTGFVDLDAVLGGMRDSELLILAARPSMGKSALAMNIAEYVAIEKGVTTLFVSLEMAALELTDRVLCGRAMVNCSRARGGYLTQEERRRIVEASGELSKQTLLIDDTATRSMTEISALCRRYKRKSNLGLLVVDYLQLIQPESNRDAREVQVSKIARRLKALARELKIPVLCLAQLNRQVEAGGDKRPKLSHLRESGAIEQDADVVMFVHRPEYYDPNATKGDAEIIVGKQRNGPVGTVKLTWLHEYTRFQCAATSEIYASVPNSCGISGVKEFDRNEWQQ